VNLLDCSFLSALGLRLLLGVARGLLLLSNKLLRDRCDADADPCLRSSLDRRLLLPFGEFLTGLLLPPFASDAPLILGELILGEGIREGVGIRFVDVVVVVVVVVVVSSAHLSVVWVWSLSGEKVFMDSLLLLDVRGLGSARGLGERRLDRLLFESNRFDADLECRKRDVVASVVEPARVLVLGPARAGGRSLGPRPTV